MTLKIVWKGQKKDNQYMGSSGCRFSQFPFFFYLLQIRLIIQKDPGFATVREGQTDALNFPALR